MLRNKIVYLLAAGYSVVFAILYNEYITALAMSFILCLPVVLLVLLFCTVPFVKLKSYRSDKIITRGEEISFSFLVTNTSILPITFLKLSFSCTSVQAKDKVKQQVAIAMDAKSNQIVHCHMKANHCGIMTVSCDYIRYYDYFRVFSVRKKCIEQIKIMVLPKLYEIEDEFIPNPFGIDMDSDVFSKKRPGDDPSEVFDIREYQEGDRLHRIHWKLSSKKNQYMIKEFSLPVNCSIDIIVDLYQGEREIKYTRFLDAIYETVASLSNHLMLSGALHSITWYDVQKKECRRIQIDEWEQIYYAIEELFRVETDQEKDKFLTTYQDEYERECIADIFYVGKSLPEDIQTFINPSKESRLHVLCLNNPMVREDIWDTKISLLETDNMEASLKKVVF